MSSTHRAVRIVVDIAVGILALAALILASKNGEAAAAWLVVVGCFLLLSAAVAGYCEPSAKWVDRKG